MEAEQLIGIVSNRPEAVADYLSTYDGPYVVIRTVADIPARLHGLALLDAEQLPQELLDALGAALLNVE